MILGFWGDVGGVGCGGINNDGGSSVGDVK